MPSDLSVFASRLREFMGFSIEEFGSATSAEVDSLAVHADAEFNALALVLFSLQWAQNEPYRKLCQARQVFPESTVHWSQVPAVPTQAFKEFELSCLPPAQRSRVFHSSGTVGQVPSRHFHSPESLGIYESSALAWFRRCVSVTRPLLLLTPPPALSPHSSLVHMLDAVRRQAGVDESAFVGHANAQGTWEIDPAAARSALRSFESESSPVLVCGTAYSFVHLLDDLAGHGLRIRLPAGSQIMETGGYKGRSRELSKPQLYALIHERLGVPRSHILSEYGLSELSSQAYDSVDRTAAVQDPNHGGVRCFHFPPWARARIVSPETGLEVAVGETGLIRIYDLANVFSVMAIQTEDLAVRQAHGFQWVGRAQLAEPRGCSLMTV